MCARGRGQTIESLYTRTQRPNDSKYRHISIERVAGVLKFRVSKGAIAQGWYPVQRRDPLSCDSLRSTSVFILRARVRVWCGCAGARHKRDFVYMLAPPRILHVDEMRILQIRMHSGALARSTMKHIARTIEAQSVHQDSN